MQFCDAERVDAAARVIASDLGSGFRSAAILGTGFSVAVELLRDPHRIPYARVPDLTSCAAPGHPGEVVAGEIAGLRHLLFNGRFHLYEGVSAAEVCAPVAIARALGADRIVLTCAAGATSGALRPGSIVLIEDHINLTGTNPILAIPPAERKPPFLGLGDTYDRVARDMAARLPASLGSAPAGAVLAALPGPCFETPAEYRALARLGADLVSMSMVLEAIAARALGMRVLGMAVVANGPATLGSESPEESDVLATAATAVRSRLRWIEALLSGFARL